MSVVPGVPNIRVIIREASDQNLLVDVPNIAVKVIENDQYNVNIIPPTIVPVRTGSFTSYADQAGTAYSASYATVAQTLLGTIQSASYALTASYVENAGGGTGIGFPYSGSAVITGSLQVVNSNGTVGPITASLLGTASVAEGIHIVSAGIYATGSDSFVVPTPSGGFSIITSASYALTASWAPMAQGVYSASAQISQSGFVSSSTINMIQTITSASYAGITPVSGTLYIIIN